MPAVRLDSPSPEPISPIDLGWAAGFLEGEGSFYCALFKNRGYSTGQLWVGAPQAEERAPIDKLHRLFGGFVRYNHILPAKPHYKPQHIWRLTGPRAAGVILTLYTLMSPKRRRQMEKALARWKPLRGWGGFNRARTHCKRGHEFTPENTYTPKYKKGRMCRQCHSDYQTARKKSIRQVPEAWV